MMRGFKEVRGRAWGPRSEVIACVDVYKETMWRKRMRVYTRIHKEACGQTHVGLHKEGSMWIKRMWVYTGEHVDTTQVGVHKKACE